MADPRNACDESPTCGACRFMESTGNTGGLWGLCAEPRRRIEARNIADQWEVINAGGPSVHAGHRCGLFEPMPGDRLLG